MLSSGEERKLEELPLFRLSRSTLSISPSSYRSSGGHGRGRRFGRFCFATPGLEGSAAREGRLFMRSALSGGPLRALIVPALFARFLASACERLRAATGLERASTCLAAHMTICERGSRKKMR